VSLTVRVAGPQDGEFVSCAILAFVQVES
jgi:hypothetical protein